MEISKSKKSRNRMIYRAIALAVGAATTFYSYRETGAVYTIFLSYFLLSWSLYILYKLLNPRPIFKKTENGFAVQCMLSYETARWDQLIAISDPSSKHSFILIAAKKKPEEPTEILTLFRNTFQPEDLEKIVELILLKRPDLPVRSYDDIHSRKF